MAKNTRSGLGRGLNSLLSGASDSPSRTTERERIVYNENEEVDYSDQDAKLSGRTGSFERVSQQPQKQASQASASYQPVSSPSQTGNLKPSSNLINSTITQTAPAPKPVEKNVSRETFSELKQSTEAKAAKEQPKEDAKEDIGTISEMDIELIAPNPDQPRTNFKKEELEELASSIKREGLIQPILIRQIEDGSYQIIAGERRWQAAKKAGLKKVPIQIKDVDDDKALEIALIENIQRSDLNPIEEAYGYRRLMERRKMTQADIAQAVSKGRSTIANALRLLDLPEEAQQLLFADKITAGHARAILSVPTKDGRESLTKKIVENKLSVRDTESIARLLSNKKDNKGSNREPLPARYKAVAKTLRDLLETNVRIKSSKGKNKIEIEFQDEAELERLFREISAGFED